MENELKGAEIKTVYAHYENVVVSDGEHAYFISPEELIKILSEFEFIKERKKTRTWIHVNIDDWRIEKFNKPRTY